LRAVVIAAGSATRLAPYSSPANPKALMELEEGVTILGHILGQLRRCGIEDIVVVVRAEAADRIRENVDGVRLVALSTQEEFGNLYSAFVGCGDSADGFLLLMSDHIFELEVLRRLIERGPKTDKSFIICLDREPSRKASEEGLKILLTDGRVAGTGKELLPVHGIDTGLIWCGPGARRYFREAIERFGKKGSIKDALNIAAERDDIDYVDVTGLLWQDIDTPEDLEKARRIYWDILRRDIIKSSDGLVARYLNRQISTRLSIYLYRERIFINPDIVSVAGFLVALLGGVSILAGQLVVGGLLVQASSIIDGVDGEIARLFNMPSRRGGILDAILDRIADVFVVIAIALYLWPLGPLESSLSLLAAANSVLVSYSTQLLGAAGVSVHNLRAFPATRDVRLLVVALSCVAGYPLASLYYLGVVPLVYVAAATILAVLIPAAERPLFRRWKTRKLWPDIPRGVGVRAGVNNLVQNGLRMLFALLVTRLMLPPFHDIVLFTSQTVELELGTLTPAVEAALIIVFGSKMLAASGVIAEYLSVRLVKRLRITSFLIRGIFKDLSYLLFALVIWSYAWQLAEIPLVGQYVTKLTIPSVSIVIIYMVYRITRRIYNTYHEILEDRARRMEEP